MSGGKAGDWQVVAPGWVEWRRGWGACTLASPQLRTNLSPFTKDFRVEVQHNESIDSFLGCPDGLGRWGDDFVANRDLTV